MRRPNAPWHVGTLAMNIGCLEIGDNQSKRIATLNALDYSGRVEQMFNDARLIAVAPELYEALQKMYDAFYVGQAYTDESALGQADAVLKKMEGIK